MKLSNSALKNFRLATLKITKMKTNVTKIYLMQSLHDHLPDLLAGDGLTELVCGPLRNDDDVQTLAGVSSLNQLFAKSIRPVNI